MQLLDVDVGFLQLIENSEVALLQAELNSLSVRRRPARRQMPAI